MLTTIIEKNGDAAPGKTMRALAFTGPSRDLDRSVVAEVRAPTPGPGEVTVDVAYAGVNFKDVMVRRGDRGYAPGWPFIAGLEVAGHVRAVGEGVAGLRVGDRVVAYTGSGGLAEVAVADARLVVTAPPAVALADGAALIGTLVTAHLLVHELGRVRRGDRVLVHGAAGGVGAAVAAIARQAGLSGLVGTVGTSTRIAQATALGYDSVMARDAADLIDAEPRLGRFDLILDPQGTSLLELDLALLRPGGRIVLFGNAGGGRLGDLPPLSTLLSANASIGGFSLAALAANAPRTIADAIQRVLESVASGALAVDAHVLDGLESVPEAHQALAEGRGLGKYEVRVRTAVPVTPASPGDGGTGAVARG